jgi:RNA polymerase sigma-70 factor (ECF subfamily)
MRNEEEFIALVRANERIIYKVCSFYVSPRVSAEDLWQEVVANLWRGYSGFRAESAPSTWIYRIALNTCVSYIRRESRHTLATKTPEPPEAAVEHETGDERIAQLYELISTLGAIDKAVILLWLEEKSYAEIAEITGLTAANVGVRLNRIKNRLKSNELWNSRK